MRGAAIGGRLAAFARGGLARYALLDLHEKLPAMPSERPRPRSAVAPHESRPLRRAADGRRRRWRPASPGGPRAAAQRRDASPGRRRAARDVRYRRRSRALDREPGEPVWTRPRSCASSNPSSRPSPSVLRPALASQPPMGLFLSAMAPLMSSPRRRTALFTMRLPLSSTRIAFLGGGSGTAWSPDPPVSRKRQPPSSALVVLIAYDGVPGGSFPCRFSSSSTSTTLQPAPRRMPWSLRSSSSSRTRRHSASRSCPRQSSTARVKLTLIVEAANAPVVERFMAPFAQMGAVTVRSASLCERVVGRGAC